MSYLNLANVFSHFPIGDQTAMNVTDFSVAFGVAPQRQATAASDELSLYSYVQIANNGAYPTGGNRKLNIMIVMIPPFIRPLQTYY